MRLAQNHVNNASMYCMLVRVPRSPHWLGERRQPSYNSSACAIESRTISLKTGASNTRCPWNRPTRRTHFTLFLGNTSSANLFQIMTWRTPTPMLNCGAMLYSISRGILCPFRYRALHWVLRFSFVYPTNRRLSIDTVYSRKGTWICSLTCWCSTGFQIVTFFTFD